jgi:hypothetical protein
MDTTDLGRQLQFLRGSHQQIGDYEASHWMTGAYQDIFERVLTEGDQRTVFRLVDAIDAQMRGDVVPSHRAVAAMAEGLLVGGTEPAAD